MKYDSLVSCVIPSYKRADTLRRAINSVLAQTYSNVEVLVVDDNIAGDEYSITLQKIIDEYKSDSRVILVTQPKHINGAEARNAGVRASHGEYIAFLDDDDEWQPDKIERQIIIMKNDSQLGGVAGGVTLWENGVEISSLPKETIKEEGLLYKVLTREVGLATSSFLCKKSAFYEMGGFDVSLRRSQDLQLFAHFLAKYRIYPISEFRTVKMHVESSINRLDAKRLAANKEEFFESVKDVLALFKPSVQQRIKSAHYYEVACVAIREKKYLFAIKYMFKGFNSRASVKDLYYRYNRRKSSK